MLRPGFALWILFDRIECFLAVGVIAEWLHFLDQLTTLASISRH
jgi:hypothetical protein